MKLPEDLEAKILSLLNLEKLYSSSAYYQNVLDMLRKKMVTLSYKLAAHKQIAPEDYDAYFIYNFPQNFMKSMLVAKRLFGIYKIPLRNEYEILDIGCGEGAGFLGLGYFLNILNPQCRLRIIGVDTSHSSLQRCQLMVDWFKEKHLTTETRLTKESALKFLRRKQGNYDFIILANSLVEIIPSEKIHIAFLHLLFCNLKKTGFILILEPALKELSRRLMETRKDVIKSHLGNILLPCLHNEECPLLFKKNDWCHQSWRWSPPEFLKIINQKLFRKIEYLKFSYLVISPDKYPLLHSHIYPVISRLAKEKGRRRCFICSKEGMIELIRLNREANIQDEMWTNISMGDFLHIAAPVQVKPNLWRITPNSIIKRLDF
ncbi:MAG: small ribosomal subunit Rsm22 family protein [candidate division WOR-3 bacterium]